MLQPRTIWIGVKSSLWFIPALMIAASAGLAVIMVALDSYFSMRFDERWPEAFGAGAEGSRTLLAAIATSMVALASVSFSITIVALSLAANQYTPRVLRNFMRDWGNQFVLGVFVSIFIYCLIVLRTIRGEDEPFVPGISVVLAILLAVLGIAAFIYFIHHVATMIQVSSILAAVTMETLQATGELFPEQIGEEEDEEEGTETEKALLRDQKWEPVPAEISGYIQTVSTNDLLRCAVAAKTVIRFDRGIGDYVTEGNPLAYLLARKNESTREIAIEVRSLFGISTYRTIEQDPAFGIRQIVDIALKALSPGVNDPTTAVNCLDHLETILRRLVQRRIPSPFRYHEGALKVIARGPTFEFLVDLMFHEIRLHARNNLMVILRVLCLLEHAACSGMPARRRHVFWKHASLLAEQVNDAITLPHDRELINQKLQSLAIILRKTGELPSVMLPLQNA